MQQFITFREKDDNGDLQYYVLQRRHPHIVGLISPSPLFFIVPSCVIGGYNLWVSFSGCLIGNFIPSYMNVEDEISQTIEEMSAWYLENRILADEKKYKKFKA